MSLFHKFNIMLNCVILNLKTKECNLIASQKIRHLFWNPNGNHPVYVMLLLFKLGLQKTKITSWKKIAKYIERRKENSLYSKLITIP
jgi:hypothetical protein